jgi:nitroimidazol reductase NimA-like FMN-containing flavoprotein (pyridoxamine 5'-phosphate oxidase superfamily)
MQTERVRVRRHPERGAYDPTTVNAILDEALVCHLGFVHDGQPYVIPTLHARVGDRVFIHGSAASRMLGALGAGIPACLTVTLLDGLVLARSAYNQSVNYRSVVLLGTATPISENDEKLEALRAFTEHVAPGRWDEIRHPTAQELKATSVLSMPLAEASAKVRTGPPADDEADYAMDIWAGVLPLQLQPLAPVNDPRLPSGLHPPQHLLAYSRV